MRILMILSTPFPPEEGIGYFVYNLSTHLIRAGNDVTIITRGRFSIEEEDFKEIKIIRLPFFPFYPFHVQLSGQFLNKYLKEEHKKYDIVHVHSPLSPIPYSPLPIISTIHTSISEDANHLELVDIKSLATKIMSRTVSKNLISDLLEASEIVTTVSDSVAQELDEYYGYGKAQTIGNGVDERLFIPGSVRNEEKYLLYVGRLSYRKGLFDLFAAAKNVLKENNLKLVICGKGELEKQLRNIALEQGLDANVEFVGYVDRNRLIELYQNAYAFVFPSHYEGLPTVILEAMSCGLPVLAADIPSYRGTIKNSMNGLLFKVGSIEDLSDKIQLIIDNEDLRKNLGKNARVTIERRFTWDLISNQFLRLYRSIIESQLS